MTVRIVVGHVLDKLAALPAESVHCIWTSVPYWGLRAYGTEPQVWSCGWTGEHGLEPTLQMWLDNEVTIWRALRRVLRKDGVAWLNVGDAYATAPNGRSAAATKAIGNDDRTFRDKPINTTGLIYDPQGGGGYRGYNKGNSGRSHPGGRVVACGVLKSKNRIMLPARLAIALQEDGWWLRDEIVWFKKNPMPSSVSDRTTPAHEMLYLLTRSARYYYDAEAIKEPASGTAHARVSQKMPDNWDTGGGAHGSFHRQGREKGARNGVGPKGSPAGSGVKYNESFSASVVDLVPDRNKRSVWPIATEPFAEAHFATAPTALVEPCILAGTSEKGCCPACGAPWRRCLSELGWEPTCKCPAADTVPCNVLDPFGGSGTTGLVADRLGRNAILIELNPDYAAMARRRITEDGPLFAEVAD